MGQNAKFEKFSAKIKNHPLVSSLVVLGTIVIALSTFTDAAKNLLSLISWESRAAINGEWKAEVTYDWDRAKYTETFVFNGEGEEIYGTASFLKGRVGITEGKVAGDRLQFITKTKQTINSQEWRDSIHRYRGKLIGDEIKFVMHTEGGYTQHVPIEFTAKRVAKAP